MFRYFFVQITATVLICLFVLSFIMIFFFVSSWKTDIYGKLANETNYVYAALGRDGQDADLAPVCTALRNLSEASATDVFVADGDGRIVVCGHVPQPDADKTTDCPLHAGRSLSAELMAAMELSPATYNYQGALENYGDREVFLSGRFLTEAGGKKLYAVSAEPTDAAYRPYTTDFVRTVILTSAAAVLISFFASVATSYRISKPIREITEATKQYAGGNFNVKIPEMHSYNELETLIDSVNSMADSLSVLERSRSNFVANVSHELKTPMTTISGFIDGILDGTIEGEDRDRYLKIVSDEVKRLSGLVVAMLNMSKIEAGKLTLKRSDVNLRRMIFSIMLTFEKAIESKNIDVLGLDRLADVTVDADDALMNQILYNIIDNAVKFTPENGEISFSLVSDKKFAEIRIRNTGAGISREDAALIFDRFYKVDKSRGLDSQSFGMGLYIVKSIVELHGGSITLNSEPGKYTEFVIKIPE